DAQVGIDRDARTDTQGNGETVAQGSKPKTQLTALTEPHVSVFSHSILPGTHRLIFYVLTRPACNSAQDFKNAVTVTFINTDDTVADITMDLDVPGALNREPPLETVRRWRLEQDFAGFVNKTFLIVVEFDNGTDTDKASFEKKIT